MIGNTTDNLNNINWDFILGNSVILLFIPLVDFILSEGILLPCLAIPGIVGNIFNSNDKICIFLYSIKHKTVFLFFGIKSMLSIQGQQYKFVRIFS